MKPGPLWRVTVTTTPEAEDAVGALLEQLFDQPPSSFSAEGEDLTVVSVYSSQPGNKIRSEQHALSQGLKCLSSCGLDLGPAQITIGKVPREDWSESWKKHFQAIEIGSTLLIKPTWDRRVPAKGAAVVRLDPGLSFGTGQHPTTAFCLEQIAETRTRGVAQSFLDLGTGSGILAIAAAKLGYHPVRAIDNDPLAVRAAKANARRNRIAHKVTIVRSDLTRTMNQSLNPYDLVCANLTSDLQVDACSRLCAWVRPGGKLVLAGILTRQFSAVQKVYLAAGFTMEKTRVDGEWQSGRFAKSTNWPGLTKRPRGSKS